MAVHKLDSTKMGRRLRGYAGKDAQIQGCDRIRIYDKRLHFARHA